jgi:hypothetical protein
MTGLSLTASSFRLLALPYWESWVSSQNATAAPK